MVNAKIALDESAKRAGFEIEYVPAETATDVPDAAAALMSRDIDAVLQIPGNLTASAFGSISEAARRSHLPVFAFQKSQAIGGAAFMPTDGTATLDYMLSTAMGLVPTIQALHAITFRGSPSHQLRFEANSPEAGVPLSDIVRASVSLAGTPNEVRALRGVSLQIEEGSFVTVIGTNGSGKSTLLNAVAGSFFVDGGAIAIAGREVTRWPEHRRAALIGRVFQNPFSGTAPTMTVAENLALAARRGLGRGLGSLLPARLRNELRDRVAMLNMQLETRMHNPIGTLSGGQRQALTLLMATWRRPELLLLDEHTAALDPKSADQIVRLTERIVSAEVPDARQPWWSEGTQPRAVTGAESRR